MAKRTLIRDLAPNQFLSGVFAIHNCQLGQTKTGKPYIKCLIGDKSKRVPGRMWNASEELFAELPTDGFVYIEGQSQPYQGELQIIIQDIRKTLPSAEELSDLLPSTEKDVTQMYMRVTSILGKLEDPGLAALAKAYLDDQTLMDKFRQAPAAMNLHHAYLGGLLEHTLSLLNLAELVCPLYPQVSRDMVVMGLFIHDLGKCGELSWDKGFSYTDEGQLIGHIAQGILGLQDKADWCANLGTPVSPSVLMVLHHIILSHHGRPEYGALKIPATPEAILVSMLDNLDAKMQMAVSAARGDETKSPDLGGNFTEKIWALDTKIFRPDPTTME